MSDEAQQDSGELPEVSASTAARLLSVLLITEDDDLEGFRKRSIAKDSTIEPERLRAARQLLEVVGATLLSTEEAHWRRLLDAHERLCRRAEEPGLSDVPASAAAEQAADSAARAEVGVPPRVDDPAPAPAGPRPFVAPPGVASPLPPAPAYSRSEPAAPVPVAPQRPPSVVPPPPTPDEVSPLARRVELPPVTAAQTESLADVSGEAPAAAREPLPFKPGAGRTPPPSAVDDPTGFPQPEVGETIGVGAMSPLAGMELPFGRGARKPASQPPAARVGSTPPSAGQGAASEPPPEPDARSEPVAPSPSDAPTAMEMGETAAVGVMSPLAGMELPFRRASGSGSAPPPPPQIPELSVEQYAAIHAACEADPDRVADTRRQHGVADEATWQALNHAWNQRLQADPALRQQFAQLLTQYRQWHQSQR